LLSSCRHNKKSPGYGYQATLYIIPGNDKADLEAKQATTQECGKESQLEYSDFRNPITRHQLTMQNVRWKQVKDNKMREHNLKLSGCRNYLTGQRKEVVFVSRIRILHTRLTHGSRLPDETTSGAEAA
jgi:hypothetical protein